MDNEHFSRQHATQTNKLMLKLKLKIFSTIFPYSWKEKMHTFCEKIAKIYINLPVPNKFRRPSFFSSTLNTDYSIFIKQNKKIIIIKQLIYFLFKSSSEICSNRFIMAAAETSISNPPPKLTSAGGFEIERTSS
jgi:hypothetical protein